MTTVVLEEDNNFKKPVETDCVLTVLLYTASAH